MNFSKAYKQYTVYKIINTIHIPSEHTYLNFWTFQTLHNSFSDVIFNSKPEIKDRINQILNDKYLL